jgi:hypothetical protein
VLRYSLQDRHVGKEVDTREACYWLTRMMGYNPSDIIYPDRTINRVQTSVYLRAPYLHLDGANPNTAEFRAKTCVTNEHRTSVNTNFHHSQLSSELSGDGGCRCRKG